ncbi:MAG: hypothetical protein KGI25_06325 [Thaumarchaeota archaeon]|nr:hypothetical protein [Nitrososphaerota archaeon]
MLDSFPVIGKIGGSLVTLLGIAVVILTVPTLMTPLSNGAGFVGGLIAVGVGATLLKFSTDE